MIAYSRDEMISVTDILKSFKAATQKILFGTVDKIAIMRNNKPELVLVSVDEYERLKEIAEYAERLAIKQIVDERKQTKPAEFVPFASVLVEAGLKPDEL